MLMKQSDCHHQKTFSLRFSSAVCDTVPDSNGSLVTHRWLVSPAAPAQTGAGPWSHGRSGVQTELLP